MDGSNQPTKKKRHMKNVTYTLGYGLVVVARVSYTVAPNRTHPSMGICGPKCGGEWQRNLLTHERTHTHTLIRWHTRGYGCGWGRPLPFWIVRPIMAVRVASTRHGYNITHRQILVYSRHPALCLKFIVHIECGSKTAYSNSNSHRFAWKWKWFWFDSNAGWHSQPEP